MGNVESRSMVKKLSGKQRDGRRRSEVASPRSIGGSKKSLVCAAVALNMDNLKRRLFALGIVSRDAMSRFAGEGGFGHHNVIPKWSATGEPNKSDAQTGRLDLH